MGQGPAPAGATVEHYVAEGLDLVPGSGALAAAVPAAVDAWLLLLRDHGTWELDAVLDFAIGYARDGHPMLGRVGTTIAAVSALFQTHWPTSAELWMPGGRIPAEGELVWNPAYARTLERLVRGRSYGNPPARRESMRPAASGGRVSWPAPWWSRFRPRTGIPRARITAECSPWTIWRDSRPGMRRPPPWSSGATRSPRPGPGARGRRCCRPWPSWPASRTGYLDPSTELGAHTILEAQKLALADREAYYGDTDVPLDYLLSEDYCAGRRALITDRASHDFRPGTVPGREPYCRHCAPITRRRRSRAMPPRPDSASASPP